MKKVLSLIAIYVVLLSTTNMPAFAATYGAPQCPPDCNLPGYGYYYRPMLFAHVGFGNPLYQYNTVAYEQITAGANELQSYYDSQTSQTWASAQAAVLQQLGQVTTMTQLPTVIYQNSQSFGNQIPESVMNDDIFGPLTPTLRQQIQSEIQSQGLKAIVAQVITKENAMAAFFKGQQGALRIHQKILDAQVYYGHGARLLEAASPAHLLLVNRPAWVDIAVDSGVLAAAILVAIPGLEPLGLGVAIGVGIFAVGEDVAVAEGWDGD